MVIAYKNWVTDPEGNVLGASPVGVVIKSSGLDAELFSDDVGTPLANPFLAEADGAYEFFTYSDLYDVVIGTGLAESVFPLNLVGATAVEGQPFVSRIAAEASYISDEIDSISVFTSVLNVVRYTRNASGDALTTNGGATNWAPANETTPNHWLDNTIPGTTGMSAAILAGATWLNSIGGGKLVLLQEESYLLDVSVLLVGFTDVVIDIVKGAHLLQGVSAEPGIEFQTSIRCGITGKGEIVGNRLLAGRWETLVTTGGITDGEKTGTAQANVSAGSTAIITIENLGIGWIKKGDRIAYIDSAITYAYVCQADSEISGGTVTITLDRVLDVDIDIGQNIFVNQPSRMQCTSAAYAAGTTSITLETADVTSTGTAQLVPGDQFVRLIPYNLVTGVDYSQVYTVATGDVYTGAYPVKSVDVVITPGLAEDWPIGQRISSIQDHRNNNTTILFFGCSFCYVEGVTMSDGRIHGLTFNACINAPWSGLQPSANPNTNCHVRGVLGLGSSGDGGVVTAAWNDHFSATENVMLHDLNATRSGVIMERATNSDALANNVTGGRSGVSISGECDTVEISDNVLDGCVWPIRQANSCSNVGITGNLIKTGLSSSFGILVFSGNTDEEGEETGSRIRNNNTIVSDNVISGPTKTSNLDFGAHIHVSTINNRAELTERDWPRGVQVVNNTSKDALAEGIKMLYPIACSVLNNYVVNSGLAGISLLDPVSTLLGDNIVTDSGLVLASPAILIDGGDELTISRNRSQVVESAGQTFGIELVNQINPVRWGEQNWFSAVLSGNVINDADTSSNINVGLRALENLEDGIRNVSSGRQALQLTTSGDNNVAVGDLAGRTLVGGNRNTFVGGSADADTAARNDSIAIGFGAIAKATGEIALGDDDTGRSDGVGVVGTATAGAGGAVPVTAEGYLTVRINGAIRRIPLFLA